MVSVVAALSSLAVFASSAPCAAGFSTTYHNRHFHDQPYHSASQVSFSNNSDNGCLPDLSEMCYLGLFDDTFVNKSDEDTVRCLREVVGLPDEDAKFVTIQARQVGVSLIDEFHLEYAEAYEEELAKRGLVCKMVSADE